MATKLTQRLTLIALLPAVALGMVVGFAGYLVTIFTRPETALRVAVAADECANAAFKGDSGETISSRAAKAQRRGERWGCVLCRVLDWVNPGHCADSIIPDRGRKV
jgi:hypothetical protein